MALILLISLSRSRSTPDCMKTELRFPVAKIKARAMTSFFILSIPNEFELVLHGGFRFFTGPPPELGSTNCLGEASSHYPPKRKRQAFPPIRQDNESRQTPSAQPRQPKRELTER